MKEHFRGVVWGRRSILGQSRYIIVGMIVSGHPIEALEHNEVLLDGLSFGLGDILAAIRSKKTDFRLDANGVLSRLNELVISEDAPMDIQTREDADA